jgi:drug/metabolite transporter (DMT)-like permease
MPPKAPGRDPGHLPLVAVLATAAAMTAFAANSLLCRLALRDAGTDPFGFTAIRLGSGAVMLWFLLRLRRRRHERTDAAARAGSWPAGFWLFLYAIAFSYAYVELDAGSGALLLFGVVQTTMIVGGLLAGERPGRRDAIGLLLAAAGVVYLVSPTVSTPALLPALSMATAGLAWGLYSLRGRGGGDPAAATCGNFIRAVPMALATLGLAAACGAELRLQGYGIVLATASGALASGLGYVLWYAALVHLDATRAAIVQLTAPVLAALGGVVFLAETVSWRLGVAAALVLGGVALATTAPRDSAA